jgi:hypothetical protein
VIGALTEYARGQWETWFERQHEELGLAIGSGGPAHRTRAAVFVFDGHRRSPSVVMKIAFTELEAGFLRHEHDALAQLRPRLPIEMRRSMPRALGLAEIEGNTVLSMQGLPGKRLLVPSLDGTGGALPRRLLGDFYRKSFAWSRDLATATSSDRNLDGSALADIVDRYTRLGPQPGSTADRLTSFRSAVEASGIVWSPSWQHADLAVGNVLFHRGEIRLLDWEHASAESQPWFDLAQSPGATARLAKRQMGAGSSREAAMRALGRSGWAGEVLRSEMESAREDRIPVGWAVALASMATAVRQADDARMGAEDWSELTAALLADDELRAELPWMVPDW